MKVTGATLLDAHGEEPAWSLETACGHSGRVVPRVRRVAGKRFVEEPPRKVRCHFCEAAHGALTDALKREAVKEGYEPDEIFASTDNGPDNGE